MTQWNRQYKFRSLLVLLTGLGLLHSNYTFAIIDPGTVALLTAIAGYTAETVKVLKNTSDLLEIGNDIRGALSEQEDTTDSLAELFEEINPDGKIRPSEQESYRSFQSYQNKLNSLGDTISDLDTIKLNSRYLKSRMDRSDPRKIATWARTATRAIRIGKKIANLLPKSHDEEVAWNTEVIRGQNYSIGKALLDIRSEVRASNERYASDSVNGTINTVTAIEQLNDAVASQEMVSPGVRRGI